MEIERLVDQVRHFRIDTSIGNLFVNVAVDPSIIDGECSYEALERGIHLRIETSGSDMYVFGEVPLVDGAPFFSVEQFLDGYPKSGLVGALRTPRRACSEAELTEIHTVIDEALKSLLESHREDLMPLASTSLSNLGAEIIEQNHRLRYDLSETESEIEAYKESLVCAIAELEKRHSIVKFGERFKEKYDGFMRNMAEIDPPSPVRR